MDDRGDRSDGREPIDQGQPPEYLVGRIQEAIAHDPRIGELEVDVRLVGEAVYLDGVVATEERKEAITELVARLLPGCRVHNRMRVGPFPERPRPEELP